jgi:hypothetical protein
MERILAVGENESLLQTRTRVLERLGADVVACAPYNLASGLDDDAFDVVVLCHSLAANTALAVSIGARKRWPGVKILQVVRYDYEKETHLQYADAVAAGNEPDDLLGTTKNLLSLNPDFRRVG